MGANPSQADKLLFEAHWQGMGAAQTAAGQTQGIQGSGGANPNYSVAQSLQYGTQYLAQIQKAHPGWTPEQIAKKYNGGQLAGYEDRWQKGFQSGTSDQTLIHNALGDHATKAQIAQFRSYIPAIRANAKKYGVGADIISRTMGVESSGGTAGTTNVLQVTGDAVRAVGGTVIPDGNAAPTAGPDQATQDAILAGTTPDNVALAMSQIVQPLSKSSATFLTGATTFAASVASLVAAINGPHGMGR